MRSEKIGDVIMYCGDCRDVMGGLGRFDLCVTDPPYGIGRDGQKKTTGGNGGRKAHQFKGWDGEAPDREVFDTIRGISANQVIWGGNYFADKLPPSGGWLVWDKGQRINQSDGELAYTSKPGALRIFTQNRVALLLEGSEHPTQKPIEVMRRSILQFPNAETVIDPYMGVASTLVACAKLGRKGIGIELDPDYFEIACKRVEEAYRQPDLFVAPPPEPQQEDLGL